MKFNIVYVFAIIAVLILGLGIFGCGNSKSDQNQTGSKTSDKNYYDCKSGQPFSIKNEIDLSSIGFTGSKLVLDPEISDLRGNPKDPKDWTFCKIWYVAKDSQQRPIYTVSIFWEADYNTETKKWIRKTNCNFFDLCPAIKGQNDWQEYRTRIERTLKGVITEELGDIGFYSNSGYTVYFTENGYNVDIRAQEYYDCEVNNCPLEFGEEQRTAVKVLTSYFDSQIN